MQVRRRLYRPDVSAHGARVFVPNLDPGRGESQRSTTPRTPPSRWPSRPEQSPSTHTVAVVQNHITSISMAPLLAVVNRHVVVLRSTGIGPCLLEGQSLAVLGDPA